jgi:hypothetical protein
MNRDDHDIQSLRVSDVPPPNTDNASQDLLEEQFDWVKINTGDLKRF